MYKHGNACCVCGECQYGGEHVRSCVMQGQIEKQELHTVGVKKTLTAFRPSVEKLCNIKLLFVSTNTSCVWLTHKNMTQM